MKTNVEVKTYLKRKLYTVLLFVLSSIVIESFLFITLGFGIFPKYFCFDLALILFFASIIFILPFGWFQDFFVCFVLFLQILLAFINVCINNSLTDVFTFDMLSLVDETARVLTTDMIPFGALIFYVILFGLDITGVVLLHKIKVKKFARRDAIKFVLRDIAIGALTFCFALYSFAIVALPGSKGDELYYFSDSMLHNTFSSNRQSLAKFGSWGFYFEEFFRRFYTVEPRVRYSRVELESYANSSEYNPKDQPLYGKAKGDNVLAIMMESFEWYVINPELTPTLYALARGYNFGTKADGYKNFNFYEFNKDEDGFTVLDRTDYDYNETGKKYIKNLIDLFNDESLFDNFGLHLTNYYSKAKTDYSEASVILGNYPYNESFTTHGGVFGYSSKNLYEDISYEFTLPNLLKSSGAIDVANYMHGYISTFYGRDKLIPQFGFDNSLFLDQMSSKIETQNRLSHCAKDSQIMDYYLNIAQNSFMPKDKKFLSFYTSVTTHGEYSENPLLTKHYEFVDSIDYFGKTVDGANNADLSEQRASEVRTYMASALDLEYAVTIALKYLMDNDMFENTTIAMYADHQAYYDGLDVEYKGKYFSNNPKYKSSPICFENATSYNDDYSIISQDRFKVPAFIYSTKITNEVVGGKEGHNITKLTCAFDLTTTIFNLLGVDYISSYYMGYPVICKTQNALGEVVDLGVKSIISPTGGIFDLYIYTEDGVSIKYAKKSIDKTEYAKSFSYEVVKQLERWYKISALYNYDMLRYNK